MNTKIMWIAIIAIVLIGGAWYMLAAQKAAAPTVPESAAIGTETGTAPAAGADTDATATITLTDAGFMPSTVTVNAGDTVRFVNQSSRGMWVGSDEHPTHTEYDGTTTREHCADGANTTGTFDQCSAAASGASWEYTFEKPGTFGFHNHVGASNTGTVIVN